MEAMDKDRIKSFVKETLGCTCSDDVFQHIECEAAVDTGSGLVLDYEINVGNQLLIYVYVVSVDEHHDTLRDVVSHLVRLGTEKRDVYGFNRFRLVLLTADPWFVEERASETFYSLVPDDRVHLHVISDDEFDRTE